MTAVAIGSVGCGAHGAVTRFSNEYDCPQEQVRMEELGAQTFRVTGCGTSATYVCLISQPLCQRDGPAVTVGGSAAARSPQTPSESDAESEPEPSARRALVGKTTVDGERVPALRLSLSRMPVVFAPRPKAEPPTMIAAIEPLYEGQAERCSKLELWDGNERRTEVERRSGDRLVYTLPIDELRDIIASDALRLQACQRSMWLSRPEREAFAKLVREVGSASASDGDSEQSDDPEASGEQSASEQSTAAAQRVRDELEQRRARLLACTNEDVLGIRLRWSEEDGVSVALNGELSGSSDEECVRSQLQDLRAPDSESGELVHVLTREEAP